MQSYPSTKPSKDNTASGVGVSNSHKHMQAQGYAVQFNSAVVEAPPLTAGCTSLPGRS